MSPGDLILVRGKKYKILSGVTDLLNSSADTLTMTEMLYYLKNIETGGILKMYDSELREKGELVEQRAVNKN
mgnify:CR=1 FL=1